MKSFIRSLAALIRPRGGSALLLTHVDKATARGMASGSDDYSGSTAWNNSMRSRLFLKAADDGSLTLEHQKCNHGSRHEPVALRWTADGIPDHDRPLSPVVQGIANRGDTAAVLKLLQDAYARGEWVSVSPFSRNHAVNVLGEEKTYPKRKKNSDVFQLLRDAERQGLISQETYRDRHRNDRDRWALTDAGLESIGLPASTASSASTSEVDAHPAVNAGDARQARQPALGGVGGNATHAKPDAPAATGTQMTNGAP